MAAITPTAASVFKSAAGMTENGILGASLTAGTFVYRDSGAANVYKAADNTSAAKATVAGVLLNGGGTGQPATIATSDAGLVFDAVLVAGKVYLISATAGKVIEDSELATGQVTVCGTAASTTVLMFNPVVTGVVRV